MKFFSIFTFLHACLKIISNEIFGTRSSKSIRGILLRGILILNRSRDLLGGDGSFDPGQCFIARLMYSRIL